MASSHDREVFERWLIERVEFYSSGTVGQLDPQSRLSELGLNSMCIAELVADIEDRLQTEVSLGLLFQQPTIQSLLDHLLAAPDSSPGHTEPPV